MATRSRLRCGRDDRASGRKITALTSVPKGLLAALACSSRRVDPEGFDLIEDARMKAAVFDSFGEPSEVLRVREVPDPKPGPGEVRVRMIASPINPSDLLVVQGRYGVLPEFAGDAGLRGGRNRRRSRAGLARPVRQGQARRGDQLRRGATGPSSPSSPRGRRGPSRTTSPTSRPPPFSSTRPPCWPWPGMSWLFPRGSGCSSRRRARRWAG